MDAPDLPSFLRPAGPAGPVTVPVPVRAHGHRAEPGLWLFVLGDLTLFGFFFVGQLVERRADPDLFRGAARLLDQTVGTTNTVVLLTSSLAVAIASDAIRRARPRRAAGFVGAAIALAATFAALKAGEYGHLVAAGHTPDTDVALTYYFVLTGIHLVHLLIGTVLLAFLVRRLLGPDGGQRAGGPFADGVAVYWHMVDLLWIVLFALLYLVAGR